MEDKEITLLDSERTKCEIWTRVMGYHRPVSEWNIGKKQEFADRQPYKLPTEFKETQNASKNN